LNINEFFGRTYVINLKRRTDRRALAEAELAISGIDPARVEFVEAHDCPEHAHYGCTRSHRELLRRVSAGPHERVLVLEDDFKALTLQELIDNGFAAYPNSPVLGAFKSVLEGRGNLAERFDVLSEFLPADFDVIYLAAGYAEPPLARVNAHVIRCGAMLTTSTYGITRDFASVWTDKVDALCDAGGVNHPGPIDSTFGLFARDHRYYVFQPRLAYQRAILSDITGWTEIYLCSMTDPIHEGMV
jgi:hypothetical protein